MRYFAPARRGFSLVEMLIALTITATLFTATLVALDAAFKGYKHTTEGASTHVVSRIVMSRIMTMVRTGTEFGPYPADPLDPELNPVHSNFIEFVAIDDPANLYQRVVRVERPVSTRAILRWQSSWSLAYSRERLRRSGKWSPDQIGSAAHTPAAGRFQPASHDSLSERKSGNSMRSPELYPVPQPVQHRRDSLD